MNTQQNIKDKRWDLLANVKKGLESLSTTNESPEIKK
jgi:hypothetical protein